MIAAIIRFIGSIKLAVPLLSTIIGILIWATFYESQVGSVAVQQAIYKSPWFGALMFMLAVNLGVSAMSRYPWKGSRKIGFALTHFGLIIIIAGSAAVIHIGMEGMLLVRTDRPGGDRLRIQGDLLEIVDSTGQVQQESIFIKQDGSVSPRYWGDLELEAYTEHATQSVSFAEGGKINNPGVNLSLSSDRMGQTIQRTLVANPNTYSTINLGPAELELIQTSSDRELRTLLNPQNGKVHPQGELEIVVSNQDKKRIRTVDVQDYQSKAVKINNVKITIKDFYPDFRLNQNKQPASASENYNNPAIALEVLSPVGKERWYVFSKNDFPPVRTLISGELVANLTLNYQVTPPEIKDYFKVIVTKDEQLYFAAKSSKQFNSGILALGQSITPGWADFQITLNKYFPHTQIQRKVIPATEKTDQGSPALLVKTKAGQRTWLLWGQASAIPVGEQEIYAAFSPKFYQIPFGIKLDDFIVERNEGAESVAMWTSQISIEDPVTGNTEKRKVWMNHPTWYKGWKIAQASWNPGDLKQSTLQVKREPAWVTALTWIGSALVIMGIAVMFYAPALNRKFSQQATPKTSSLQSAENAESIDTELSTVA